MLKVVVLSLIKGVRSAKVSLVIPVGYAMVFKKIFSVIKPREPFNKMIIAAG
jgi:hypothetical protein